MHVLYKLFVEDGKYDFILRVLLISLLWVCMCPQTHIILCCRLWPGMERHWCYRGQLTPLRLICLLELIFYLNLLVLFWSPKLPQFWSLEVLDYPTLLSFWPSIPKNWPCHLLKGKPAIEQSTRSRRLMAWGNPVSREISPDAMPCYWESISPRGHPSLVNLTFVFRSANSDSFYEQGHKILSWWKNMRFIFQNNYWFLW